VDYVIGIDGGGTRTRLALVDRSGALLAAATATGSNLHHAGEAELRETFSQVMRSAQKEAGGKPDQIAATFLGLAGVVSELDRQFITDIVGSLGWKNAIGIHHDIRTALTGGLMGQPGIALIAGTGSSCYGLSAAGVEHQCGGWGQLADDGGSASWIGHQAIRAAVRQRDGRDPETPMAAHVFDFLGIASIEDILYRLHVTGLPRHEMAELCPQVLSLADGGDAAASQIVDEAVSLLTEMVVVTAKALDMSQPKVVLAGGLATSDGTFQAALEKAIGASLSEARMIRPALPPVVGAVIEAARLAEWPVDDTWIQQLTEQSWNRFNN